MASTSSHLSSSCSNCPLLIVLVTFTLTWHPTSGQVTLSDFLVPDVAMDDVSRSGARGIPFDHRNRILPHCSDGKCSSNATSVTSTRLRVRDEGWVIPLMALSSINIFVIACFEGFVLYKAYGTNPSRRHLFLGQMLLLGLFMCSAMGFTFVPTEHWVTCILVHMGLGISYTLVFGTLLVKAVFLLSLHSGVYLPASYQGLLLFFVVAVQMALSIQWLIHIPLGVHETQLALCDLDLPAILSSLAYNVFLIVFVTALAIRSKGLRENHRESMYIGIAIGFTIPVWIAWITTSLVTGPRHQSPSLGFGIVSNATIVFLVMFLPKGRQLAAMGREGLYMEDRDALSSRSPSVYTPSFLHLKPSALPLNKQGTLYKPGGKPPASPVTEFYPSGVFGDAALEFPSTGHWIQVDASSWNQKIRDGNITASKSGERMFYLPPPPGRVWRFGFSNYPHHMNSSPPEDPYYYSGERTLSSNPNVKFFRAPAY